MNGREVAAALLSQRIQAKQARIGIIGLGFIGTTLLHGFMRAGFATVGYDCDPSSVETCRSRTTDTLGTASLALDTRPVILHNVQVLVVAVRVGVRPDAVADLTPMQNVARLLTAMDLRGRLVLLESTLPGGTTRRLARQWLGLAEIDPTFVAHCPERLSVGDDWQDLRSIPHLVGGLDPLATRLAVELLDFVVDRVVPVGSPEVSELAKLLENAFLTTNISLVAEITRLAQRLGTTGTAVCEAAATKPNGYLPFYPGPGIGGHCLRNDLAILRHTFDQLDEDAPILKAVDQTAADMPGRVMQRLVDLLPAKRPGVPGKLQGARVLLVGVGFKPGSPETFETPARPLVRGLRSAGSSPMFLDGRVAVFEVDGQIVPKVALSALDGQYFQAAIVLAGDERIDCKELQMVAGFILDASGGRAAGVDQRSCVGL
jgi:UDP-N-acetyl-D-glucosamine dehydrogenase